MIVKRRKILQAGSAALGLSAIGAGSLPGPERPYQLKVSKPAKPCSCLVGTSG